MEVEIWKAVVGWEGLYEVSDLGRVRSLDRPWEISHLKQGPISCIRAGRILSPGNADGYFQVSLQTNGFISQRKVHQLVLEAFIGPRPPGLVGRHLDGNSLNCCASNLVWGTHDENETDKIAHGTRFRGERHPRSKLREADVIAIRSAYEPGRKKGLAAKYGVDAKVIYDIAHRKIWKHVP